MVIESIAIFAICICIIVIFARSNSADYAIASIPVLIVPFFHILAYPLERLIIPLVPSIPRHIFFIGADITGLAIACFLIAIFSLKIKSKRNKQIYVVLLGAYCIVLTAIFLNFQIGRFFN